MSNTTLDPVEFRAAMARFVSGVTVVTTHDADNRPFGFTASAFSSVSLDPPLILVCLAKSADSYTIFRDAGHFAVTILSIDQADVAMRFATKGIDKFDGVPLAAGDLTGLPLVRGAAVHLQCRVHTLVEAGDHTILIGEVLGAARRDREPLLYFDRQFGRFSPL